MCVCVDTDGRPPIPPGLSISLRATVTADAFYDPQQPSIQAFLVSSKPDLVFAQHIPYSTAAIPARLGAPGILQ